jgi:hypothetical protein
VVRIITIPPEKALATNVELIMKEQPFNMEGFFGLLPFTQNNVPGYTHLCQCANTGQQAKNDRNIQKGLSALYYKQIS